MTLSVLRILTPIFSTWYFCYSLSSNSRLSWNSQLHF